MKVYFDNAATTPLAPDVMDEMCEVMRNCFGNPSSVHAYGRESRNIVEQARKQIAALLQTAPSTIFFTSGGTEADNLAVKGCIQDLGIRRIITSPLEHYAVMYSIRAMAEQGKARVEHLRITDEGHIDVQHLSELLSTGDRALVALMHANNETGNMISLSEIAAICAEFDAVFFSDTVQTMGHYPLNLSEENIHFLSASAHKFHGPKGVGFSYIHGDVQIKPMMHGGAQERNMRAGTENIYGIAGMAKALELAYRDMEKHRHHIYGLKQLMMTKLREAIPGIRFVGDPQGRSLYTILTVLFPDNPRGEMLLYHLDMAGIAVSGGSACVSGSAKPSHVMQAMGMDKESIIRFSFSRYNTEDEVAYCVDTLKKLFT